MPIFSTNCTCMLITPVLFRNTSLAHVGNPLLTTYVGYDESFIIVPDDGLDLLAFGVRPVQTHLKLI